MEEKNEWRNEQMNDYKMVILSLMGLNGNSNKFEW